MPPCTTLPLSSVEVQGRHEEVERTQGQPPFLPLNSFHNILANDGISLSKNSSARWATPHTDFIEVTNPKHHPSCHRRHWFGRPPRWQPSIDACPSLKLLAAAAWAWTTSTWNTHATKDRIAHPCASSQRGTTGPPSYRSVPARQQLMMDLRYDEFKTLKKAYGNPSRGTGIVGFGRIGRSLASYAGTWYTWPTTLLPDGKVDVVLEAKIAVNASRLDLNGVLLADGERTSLLKQTAAL